MVGLAGWWPLAIAEANAIRGSVSNLHRRPEGESIDPDREAAEGMPVLRKGCRNYTRSERLRSKDPFHLVRAEHSAQGVDVIVPPDGPLLRTQPLADERTKALRGQYRGRGPKLDTARRTARRDDAADEHRRR